MKVNILTIALTFITLIACQNNQDKKTGMSKEGQNTPETSTTVPEPPKKKLEHNPALIGKWKGVEWNYMGKPSGADATQVQFEFLADGNLKSNYADQHKNGTWRTEKDSLFTTTTGKKELPIKILRLDETVLEFEMNMRGQPEVLKFKKQ